MTIKRFAVLGLMVLLGGCYQQASDSFEAVNSDSGAQSLSASPTPQVLNPNADASPVVIVPNDGVTPTDSVVILQPDDSTPVTSDTTPTVVVIMPSVPTLATASHCYPAHAYYTAIAVAIGGSKCNKC
jgi:hypothetical protein